ncbi:MAG: N-acetylmannosamine-6-phosphate 2-epimerase [Chloroflexota bacterium]|nr:MAG: N-acetylmannosamine-6-phosphate 2-epimerase [Chloroflexota bacterium]
MEKSLLLDRLKGGLIVSCQTQAPLNGPEIMAAMAEAAVLGGAVGIRANGAEDVAAIRRRVSVPIIGINKQRSPDYQVYITPTLEAALAVVHAGAEIVALDGSPAPRPTGIHLRDLIAGVHEAGALVMADISTLDEGLWAAECGADIVATTLSGYTPYSPKLDGPDLDLIEALAGRISQPVIAEGRFYTPDDVRAAFERGAFAVVVGRAITEPQLLTRRFVQATPRAAEAGQ